ncbi:MAG: SGNH hydrolase domain-containing protein, partial [Desulfobulbales bacterium]
IYSNNNQVHYISIMDELCKDDECLFKVNNQGELLVYDYGHLTIEGSLYVVKNIIYPQLKKILN